MPSRHIDDDEILANACEIRNDPQFVKVIRTTGVTTEQDVHRALTRRYHKWRAGGRRGVRPLTSRPGQGAMARLLEAICEL
jgi:hypothetical protein